MVRAASALRPVPRFPAVSRDIAVIVDEALRGRSDPRGDPGGGRPADRVSTLASTAIAARRSRPGRRASRTRSPTAHPDRTLTDDEVNAAHGRVRSHLAARFALELAELRPRMTMTKADIVERIYEKIGFSKKEATEVVEIDLRDREAAPRRRREGQDLGLRQLRRPREAPAQGPQPADWRRDRHHRPQGPLVQSEPGLEEDHERRERRTARADRSRRVAAAAGRASARTASRGRAHSRRVDALVRPRNRRAGPARRAEPARSAQLRRTARRSHVSRRWRARPRQSPRGDGARATAGSTRQAQALTHVATPGCAARGARRVVATAASATPVART